MDDAEQDSPVGEEFPARPAPPGPPEGGVPAVPSRGGKPRSAGLIVAVVAVVVLALAGAIGTAVVLNHRADVEAAERRDAAERRAEAERVAAEEAKREAEEEAARELELAQQVHDSCQQELGRFTDALSVVDARLDVGLSQQEMSQLVGRASVAYNRIDIEALGLGRCLRAGGLLESAFNNYAGTVSTWNDCIYELYCDVDDDILPGMQTKWAKASNQIDRAERMLDTLDPASSRYKKDGSATDA